MIRRFLVLRRARHGANQEPEQQRKREALKYQTPSRPVGVGSVRMMPAGAGDMGMELEAAGATPRGGAPAAGPGEPSCPARSERLLTDPDNAVDDEADDAGEVPANSGVPKTAAPSVLDPAAAEPAAAAGAAHAAGDP